MIYIFINEGSSLEPKIYVKIKKEKKLIGGFAELLFFILNLPIDQKISFRNFNRIQFFGIKSTMIKYKKYLSKLNNFSINEDITHLMRYEDTQFMFLDIDNLTNDTFKTISMFESINTIDYLKYGNKRMAILNGIICLHGKKTENEFVDGYNNISIKNDDSRYLNAIFEEVNDESKRRILI